MHTRILEFLLMFESKVTIFLFTLDIILPIAKVSTTYWDEMYSVLHLHVHFEYLMTGWLLWSWYTDSISNKEGKNLFTAFEGIIVCVSSFVFDQGQLITFHIWFVWVSILIFVLNSDQNDQKPFIYDRVIIKIYPLYNFILFVIFFKINPYFSLLFKTQFIVLMDNTHQTQLHIEIHHCQASQSTIITYLISSICVWSLFSLSSCGGFDQSEIAHSLKFGYLVWVITETSLLLQ